MNNPNKKHFNPWPVTIISYFIAFITLTIAGVIYLSHQRMDLVRSDYYDDEIRYQEQLDRLKRASAFNRETVIVYDSSRQTILIALPPTQFGKLSGGRVELYRPSDEKMDRDIKLALNAEGAQRIDTSNLPAGLWKVRLYWTSEGKDYFVNQTITIQPNKA